MRENITKRVAWIELLRVIACFLVIVNHTNSRIFLNTEPSGIWFASLTWFFISKIAVPLFVMISGYTLLHKEENYRQVFVRIIRVASALILFSFFYYLEGVGNGYYETFSLKTFFYKIFNSSITTPFWYLYMYLGLLLMMPFLRKLVKGMEQKDFFVFFAISFCIYAIYPMIEHLNEYLVYNRDFKTPLYGSYICMLLLGNYFRRYGLEKSNKRIAICAVLFGTMCLFNVFVTYLEYIYKSKTDYLFYDDRTFFPIVLAAICIFYLVSCIELKGKWEKYVICFGKCTFGIYLVSELLIRKLEFLYQFLEQITQPLVAMLVFEGCIFGCGFLVTFFLRKIPFVRKII